MIFGIRAVMEAIQAGREVDKIMVKKDLQGDLIRELGELLKGQMVPVQRVPVERLNRITRKNHQGVIAFVSAVTYHRLEDLIPFVFEQGRDPFIVLLDGVTDVRNFGDSPHVRVCRGRCAGHPVGRERFGHGRCDEDFGRGAQRVARMQGAHYSSSHPFFERQWGEGVCRYRKGLGKLYRGDVRRTGGLCHGRRRYGGFGNEPAHL